MMTLTLIQRMGTEPILCICMLLQPRLWGGGGSGGGSARTRKAAATHSTGMLSYYYCFQTVMRDVCEQALTLNSDTL